MEIGVEPVVDAARALLARAAARDERAATELYREYSAKVYRRVARVLGSHDPELDDVVQAVFVAALDGAANFDGRCSLATWLLAIATRRAIDHGRARRRRARWQRVTEYVGLGRAPSRPDQGHDRRCQAEQALDQLSPDQRVVFVLHDVEGHTFAEISEVTGVRISTLHARLAAARKVLDRVVADWRREDEHG